MNLNADDIKEWMVKSAEEINCLKKDIYKTFEVREQSSHKWNDWKLACARFHSKYNKLAFPEGYAGAWERMIAGDALAMEAAICFLECRPYFFRSGYMFEKILRKIKLAPLSESQKVRLNTVRENLAEWKKSKSKR